MDQIPEHLISEIRAGNCIAFVGAGFSADGIPTWRNLLLEIADSGRIDEDTRSHVTSLLREPRDLDYEAAAQALRDATSEEWVDSQIASIVAHPEMSSVMEERLRFLRGIPFRAILTTNFDGYLSGEVPSRDAYLDVLRTPASRWWDTRYWDEGSGGVEGATVVKLHGDAAAEPPRDVVITRRDYRHRLYGDPAYATFLRSVLATTTVLYLGFSFGDAYFNEMRSEILALLDYTGNENEPPVAYAIVNDVEPGKKEFFRAHEGIQILTYNSEEFTDFTGFDRYLKAIYRATSPKHLLGDRISGKRILWADSTRDAEHGAQMLAEASKSSGGVGIKVVGGPEEALHLLESDLYDLVITRWGHDKAHDAAGRSISLAEQLLIGMRERDIRAPVIVFASADYANENKPAAMALGAADFTFSWEGLFRSINHVMRPATEIG